MSIFVKCPYCHRDYDNDHWCNTIDRPISYAKLTGQTEALEINSEVPQSESSVPDLSLPSEELPISNEQNSAEPMIPMEHRTPAAPPPHRPMHEVDVSLPNAPRNPAPPNAGFDPKLFEVAEDSVDSAGSKIDIEL